jgi:hypothetical protein
LTATLEAVDSNPRKTRSCQATRTLEVSDGTGNSRPVAQDDDYNTAEETELTIDPPGVLSNDNDPDADPMSTTPMSDVSNGALSLASHGGFTYTPLVGFSGSDSFTYTAGDAGIKQSLSAQPTPALRGALH